MTQYVIASVTGIVTVVIAMGLGAYLMWRYRVVPLEERRLRERIRRAQAEVAADRREMKLQAELSSAIAVINETAVELREIHELIPTGHGPALGTVLPFRGETA